MQEVGIMLGNAMILRRERRREENLELTLWKRCMEERGEDDEAFLGTRSLSEISSFSGIVNEADLGNFDGLILFLELLQL